MALRSIITPLGSYTFNSSSISGSYQALNSSAFTNAIYIIRIYNASNKDLIISYDGVNDHDAIPAATLFEIQGFPPGQNTAGAQLPALLTVYAKGTAGTGTIYTSAYTLQA